MWENVLVTSIVLMVFIAVVAAYYYFATYKNIQARRKHFEELHQNLAPKQKVEFGNGLYGIVRKVGTDVCEIEVKSGAVIEVSRYAISRLIEE